MEKIHLNRSNLKKFSIDSLDSIDPINEEVKIVIHEKLVNIIDPIILPENLNTFDNEEDDAIEAGLIDVLDNNVENNDVRNPLLETDIEQIRNFENSRSILSILTKQRRENCRKSTRIKKNTIEIQSQNERKTLNEEGDKKRKKVSSKERKQEIDFLENTTKNFSTLNESYVDQKVKIFVNVDDVKSVENEPNLSSYIYNNEDSDLSCLELIQNNQNSIKENGINYSNYNDSDQIIVNTDINEKSRKFSKKLQSSFNYNLTARTKRLKRYQNAENNSQDNFKIQEKTAKGKTLLLENESLIKKHLNMLCDLCPYTANDFIELTQHFKHCHSGIKSYIKCCTRKLNCASDIIQHAQLHEDPNYFR